MDGKDSNSRSREEEELRAKYGLQPVWTAIGEIYKEFARICDKYSLRYYASGGTALGAIRHKGFIPWDDDIDIMLPRNDYEKFLEIALKELPSHLKIVNRHNTPEFNMLFSKIQDCRRERVEAVEKQIGRVIPGGLFLDFYPMDGFPEGFHLLWTKFRYLMLDLLWHYRCCKYKELSSKGRVAFILGCLLSPFAHRLKDASQLTAAYDAILKENLYEESVYVADIGCYRSVFIQPKMETAFFKDRLPLKFEGYVMMVPRDIDAYCRNKFGDRYMQIPPELSRKSTHNSIERSPWWLGPTR